MTESHDFIDADYIHSLMSRIDRYGDYKWRFCRNLTNDYEFRTAHRRFNRAFFKLWEILSLFPHLCTEEVARTCHLGEAPGSFAQVCLWRHPAIRCILASKPPSTYAEVVKNGAATPTFYASLLQKDNVRCVYLDLNQGKGVSCLAETVVNFTGGKAQFITADGGFDERGAYDQKEMLHLNLIKSEVQMILELQEIGGSAVLKIYDTFMHETVTIIHELCRHYKKWDLYKPQTSRPTNSERYLIVQHFQGLSDEKQPPVPAEFQNEIHKISQTMLTRQVMAIKSALDCCAGCQKDSTEDRKLAQRKRFEEWCELTHFPDELRSQRSRRTSALQEL